MAGRVGKTSILLRYVRDEYNDKQASYLDKQISEGAVAVKEKKLAAPETPEEYADVRRTKASCVLAAHGVGSAEYLGHSWAGEISRAGSDLLSGRGRRASCVRYHRRGLVHQGAEVGEGAAQDAGQRDRHCNSREQDRSGATAHREQRGG
eukprot:scaffold194_cov277-Pinguiococcus_pyrenoidosus.AAC.15